MQLQASNWMGGVLLPAVAGIFLSPAASRQDPGPPREPFAQRLREGNYFQGDKVARA